MSHPTLRKIAPERRKGDLPFYPPKNFFLENKITGKDINKGFDYQHLRPTLTQKRKYRLIFYTYRYCISN